MQKSTHLQIKKTSSLGHVANPLQKYGSKICTPPKKQASDLPGRRLKPSMPWIHVPLGFGVFLATQH